MIPRASAIAPAIPSITSVKEVRATDLSYTSCIVRTDASGKFEFTDHTAWRISFRKLSVPARSLRITNVTVREVKPRPTDNEGQYTISGAFSCTPFSRTSCTTPITSCQGIDGYSVNRLPIAADGVPHNSRARFSETITTGRRPYTSVHVSSRP